MSVVLFAVVCLLTGVAGRTGWDSLSADPPSWAKAYNVSGTLQLPYAEIVEDFTGYYDGNSGLSRVDYYNHTVMTIQVVGKKAPDFGKTFKVAPMTTEKVYNARTCFQVNGTKDAPVTMQAVLPDTTGFKLVTKDVVMGHKQCQMWQIVTVNGTRKNTYSLWVEQKTGHPVRYEMMGFDSLLGSHYDRYYLDYTDYTEVKTMDPDVFNMTKVAPGIKCAGFPGPGAEDHRLLMNPMHEYINHYTQHLDPMFKHFTKHHGKDYHGKEHVQRKNIFMQNLRFIHSHNRAGHSFTLAVNHLADWTDDERKALRGRRPTKGSNGGLPFNKNKYNLKDLPSYMDWRLYVINSLLASFELILPECNTTCVGRRQLRLSAHGTTINHHTYFGAVTQVKDQAVCGSCWSFGTTGTIEGAYFLMTGKLVRLSQQELIDCSWGMGNNGCDGGEDFRAYEWITKHGLAAEDAYGSGRYMAQDMYCHSHNATAVVQTLKGYVNVTSGDGQALKVAMSHFGPVSIGIDASVKSFSFYANGIYYDSKCGNKPDDLDHAVLAVGYGTLHGKAYWLVKNSWSTYWGNDGYVLIAQRDNMCGVTTSPTYVVLGN